MQFCQNSYIIHFVENNGPSPNGKATDSDSVISRFESLWASLKPITECDGFLSYIQKVGNGRKLCDRLFAFNVKQRPDGIGACQKLLPFTLHGVIAVAEKAFKIIGPCADLYFFTKNRITLHTGRMKAEYRKAAVYGDMIYPYAIQGENKITVNLADVQGNPYAVIELEEKV